MRKWYAERDPGLKEEEKEHEEEDAEVDPDDAVEAEKEYEKKKVKSKGFHKIAFELKESFARGRLGGKSVVHHGRGAGGDGAFKLNADPADDRHQQGDKLFLNFRNKQGGMKN